MSAVVGGRLGHSKCSCSSLRGLTVQSFIHPVFIGQLLGTKCSIRSRDSIMDKTDVAPALLQRQNHPVGLLKQVPGPTPEILAERLAWG